MTAAPPRNWQILTDQVLLRLEQVGSEILSRIDPSVHDVIDYTAVLKLIEERRELIEQLAQQVKGVTATYVEWNRMVVIHHQGVQIDTGLKQARQQITAQASTRERDRAFLDCVTGVFTGQQSSYNILA